MRNKVLFGILCLSFLSFSSCDNVSKFTLEMIKKENSIFENEIYRICYADLGYFESSLRYVRESDFDTILSIFSVEKYDFNDNFSPFSTKHFCLYVYYDENNQNNYELGMTDNMMYVQINTNYYPKYYTVEKNDSFFNETREFLRSLEMDLI